CKKVHPKSPKENTKKSGGDIVTTNTEQGGSGSGSSFLNGIIDDISSHPKKVGIISIQIDDQSAYNNTWPSQSTVKNGVSN
ncbi:hypothetical protein PBSP11RLL_000502400, partial [Plasmodium berghei]